MSTTTQAERGTRAQPSRTGGRAGGFAIRDCALIAIATGQRARDVAEMREILHRVHPASIYYHFWGGLLRPKFDDPEYRNDFAIWTRNYLHDQTLAERLATLDPTQHESLEGLRSALMAVFHASTGDPKLRAQEPFFFVRSQIVVFDTGKTLERPEDLAQALPHFSLGSIFYHFIDARRRNPEHRDDFTSWLSAHGDRTRTACERLASVDYYFVPLSDLRRELGQALSTCFPGGGGAA